MTFLKKTNWQQKVWIQIRIHLYILDILMLRYKGYCVYVHNLSVRHQICDSEINYSAALVILGNLKGTRKYLGCCCNLRFWFASESWRALCVHLPTWPVAWRHLWNQCRTTSRGIEKNVSSIPFDKKLLLVAFGEELQKLHEKYKAIIYFWYFKPRSKGTDNKTFCL